MRPTRKQEVDEEKHGHAWEVDACIVTQRWKAGRRTPSDRGSRTKSVADAA